MLSTEIRINGSLIAHLYVHNEGIIDLEGYKDTYFYRYHDVESGEQKEGHITHKRSDGAKVLVKKILAKC